MFTDLVRHIELTFSDELEDHNRHEYFGDTPDPKYSRVIDRDIFSKTAKPAESRHIMPLEVAIAAETPGTPALMPLCRIDLKLSDNALFAS
ncbi:hypothetical protein BPAE_0116g00280 [Botrytis paeoniae]|uniref:Uncharacterized protein n=1 Tax=Botrytis paeoniae TaxID=278948 RepID=A0A4Z1FQM4_9HELO|nr:hypothetical protein BPAE_0116g00280 [Botrytis paeoniae]